MLLVAVVLVSFISVIISYFISPLASVVVLVSSTLSISAFLLFTKWRYEQIEQLSDYLRQISSGDFSLDVRDNYEGELSILKSEIYKVTQILSEQRATLQDEKNALADAISDISHQLKTPLTSMFVMTDLLKNENLPAEKRHEFTYNIEKQLERIDWLVSSLLKLSKFDAGTVKFKKDKVNLGNLINKAVEPLLIPFEIKEQSLNIINNNEATFIGDENWTVEAIVNILKNCLEHTSKGGEITISIDENTLFSEIKITDNGKGITKEDTPYLFQRFYKGKNASENSVGIGLSMAHEIVTKQNGTIEVNSTPNVGTTFHIKFYK